MQLYYFQGSTDRLTLGSRGKYFRGPGGDLGIIVRVQGNTDSRWVSHDSIDL